MHRRSRVPPVQLLAGISPPKLEAARLTISDPNVTVNRDLGRGSEPWTGITSPDVPSATIQGRSHLRLSSMVCALEVLFRACT